MQTKIGNIVITGSTYHVNLIGLVSRLSNIPALTERLAHRVFYQIGGWTSIRNSHVQSTLMRPFSHQRVVLHWIGSDVLSLGKTNSEIPTLSYRKRVGLFLRSRFYSKVIHFAGAPWLVRELKELGINASYIPLPANISFELPSPLPEIPCFMVYLPKGKEEFYGWSQIREAAEAYPETKWLIVQHHGGIQASSNVQFLGTQSFEEMSVIYRKITAVIRLPQHDGMSLTVLEALAAGRYVVWNYPLPGCAYCQRDTSSLIRAIGAICQATEPNIEGWNYVKEHFEPQVLIRNLFDTLTAQSYGKGARCVSS